MLRVAAHTPAGQRCALVSLRGDAQETAGPVLAAVLENAPVHLEDTRPDLDPATLRLLARMTRDYRNGTVRPDGSAGWTVPGATTRITSDSLTVESETGRIVVYLTGRGWTERQAAHVVDAMLRAIAAPEAQHMTRTTEPEGWFYPADKGIASAGRCRPGRTGGLLYDGLSTARCSCGWQSTQESRDGAQRAAKAHRAEHGLT